MAKWSSNDFKKPKDFYSPEKVTNARVKGTYAVNNDTGNVENVERFTPTSKPSNTSNLLPKLGNKIKNETTYVKNKIDSVPIVKKTLGTLGKNLLNTTPLGTTNNLLKATGTNLNKVIGTEAIKEYNDTHKEVPNVVKPLGFFAEAGNRIPLIQRAKVAAGNYLGTPTMNFDGSNMEAKTSGNKVLDKVADFGGSLAGQALVGNGPTNMLNATDNIAQYAGSKVGGKLLPSMVRGATDAAAGTVLEDIGQGKSFKDTAKDTLTNAAFGAGLFGLGKIGSEVLQGRGGDLITTSKNTYSQGINKIDNAQSQTFRQGQNLVKKEGLPQLPSPRDYTQKVNELPNDNSVIEMGGYLQDNTPINLPNNPKQTIPMKPTASTMGVNNNLDINTQPIKNNTDTGFKQATEESDINPSIGATDRTKMSIGIVTGEKINNMSPLEKIKNKAEEVYSHTVDTNAPIKKVNDETFVLATNSKKVGGTVSHIANNSLVDMQGKKIGESLGSIAKDIPRNEEHDFINYVLQRHNIDRAREGKAIDSMWDSEQSLKATSLIEQQHPEYKALSDRLTKFLNTFESEWGNKSGLISDDLWQQLQDTYKNYVPTQRSFTEIEEGISNVQGRGFVNQDNALNKATGSDRDAINPIENIVNLINRTVRTARYNEVGQSMIKAIRNNPSLSKYAEVIPSTEQINKNVNNIVTVLENGQEVNVRINDKNLLAALQGIYKSNDLNALEKGAKSFNDVFKSLITTKNPVFALRNLMRDLPTGYVYGSEKNPVKYLKDWLVAMKDLSKNTNIAEQYRALGGESANFLNTDKTYKTVNELMDRKLKTDEFGQIVGSKKINPVKKVLKGVGNVVEKVNNTVESAPRLAEFKRVLDKTGDIQKALYAAGEITTNFSRGGDITKKLDIGVPYLNAGFQGMDKFARQFNPRNPKQMLGAVAKGVVSTTVPTLILDHYNKDNKNYQELDQRTKDNYYLIPNGETFVKIPKSREIGVLFSTLTERLLSASRGQEDAFKGFARTVATNFSPTNPVENNLLSPLIYNIPKNEDFAGRKIVPGNMQDRSPQYQYDETTSEVAKKIGELTNKSPKQVDYLIKAYTGVVGQLMQPATTKQNYASGNALEKTLKPITAQFVADPLYSNKTLNTFYENYDKLKTSAADKNFAENIASKKVTSEEALRNKYTKASSEITAISKQIKEAEKTNDKEKIRELRRKMIIIAEKTNQLIK